jgi:hypothetical protein
MAVRIQERGNGVVVYQVTDEPAPKNNIYCERSYCSPDSRLFLFAKPMDKGPARVEYVACDFGTWRTRTLGVGAGPRDITRDGRFYYAKPAEDAKQELVCVDLASEQTTVTSVPNDASLVSVSAVSRDGRYLAYQRRLSLDPQLFGIGIIDVQTQTHEVIFRDRDVCNPHTQFEPSRGRRILVQHNRGCQLSPDGAMVKLLGDEGCTLFMLSVPDGAMTPLEVGPPWTRSATGHEQWIGDSGDVLCSVDAPWSEAANKGNLLRVRPGQPAQHVARGLNFMHVHASVCGRFFCADVLEGADLVHGMVVTDKTSVDCHVVVGSLDTGRHAVVYSYAYDYNAFHREHGQSSHAHPYLSPDLRWAVFNGCATGRPEIHVAAIPPEVLASLLNDI